MKCFFDFIWLLCPPACHAELFYLLMQIKAWKAFKTLRKNKFKIYAACISRNALKLTHVSTFLPIFILFRYCFSNVNFCKLFILHLEFNVAKFLNNIKQFLPENRRISFNLKKSKSTALNRAWKKQRNFSSTNTSRKINVVWLYNPYVCLNSFK